MDLAQDVLSRAIKLRRSIELNGRNPADGWFTVTKDEYKAVSKLLRYPVDCKDELIVGLHLIVSKSGD